jgi:hypothetical protein
MARSVLCAVIAPRHELPRSAMMPASVRQGTVSESLAGRATGQPGQCTCAGGGQPGRDLPRHRQVRPGRIPGPELAASAVRAGRPCVFNRTGWITRFSSATPITRAAGIVWTAGIIPAA